MTYIFEHTDTGEQREFVMSVAEYVERTFAIESDNNFQTYLAVDGDKSCTWRRIYTPHGVQIN